MLAEAITKLQQVCKEADAIEVRDVPQLRKVIVRTGSGGEFSVEDHDYPGKLINSKVFDLESFIATALDGQAAPEVYHAPTGIVLLLNRRDRHESTTLAIAESESFAALRTISKVTDPKALLNALRFDLSEAGDEVSELRLALSRIKFKKTSESSVDIQHGSVSMGKSVQAEASSSTLIPESVLCRVPVYSALGLEDLTRVDVVLGVHLDAEAGTVRVAPFADQLARAVHKAQAAIGEALRERLLSIPVYYGVP